MQYHRHQQDTLLPSNPIIDQLAQENLRLRRRLMLRDNLDRAINLSTTTEPLPLQLHNDLGSGQSNAGMLNNAEQYANGMGGCARTPVYNNNLDNQIEPAPLDDFSPLDHNFAAEIRCEIPDFDSRPVKSLAFPLKLYKILEDADKEGFSDVITFLGHGKCFVVVRPERFVKEIMPKYFKTARISSFHRQLNLYGFKRVSEGTDYGAFHHESFVRGKLELLWGIRRKKQRTPGGDSNPSDDRMAILKAMSVMDRNRHLMHQQEPPSDLYNGLY